MCWICTAYGCKRVDAFTITSSIVVSLVTADGKHITQTRRIRGGGTDLTKVHRLNALSRYICQAKPSYSCLSKEISNICNTKAYPLWLEALASAMIAGAFTMFFGGCLIDGIAATILGFVCRYLSYLMNKAGMNHVFINTATTFVLCLLSSALSQISLGHDVDKMIIGTIMLLIPVVSLTNSIRDLISGDVMSGLLRFFNALLVSGAIAAGYILAGNILRGTL